MAFDNICKFICKQYPERYVAWLCKSLPAPVTILGTELSHEPIRADSVIFLHAQDRIMHIEFQVDVQTSEPPLPLRMLDYWVRLYREYRVPIMQVVVLLKDTPANRDLKNEFISVTTHHTFHVIRLWEEEPESLLHDVALLPLAALAKTQNPEQLLNRVAEQVKKIDNIPEREIISSCTQILAGLRYEKELIRKSFKEGIMRESVIYQEILEEGLQEGWQKGRQEGLQEGRQEGLQEGRQEEGLFFISCFLQRKFGTIALDIQEQIRNLSISQLEELGEVLFDFQTIDDLVLWLQKKI